MRVPGARAAEIALCGLVLLGAAATVAFLIGRHYLPPPFLYNLDDTLMDWFNPAYYAVNGGAFDDWGSNYPPAAFAFLKLFTSPACYGGDALFARHCDRLGPATLLAFSALNLALIVLAFRKIDRSTALPRAVALGLGMPMLYALERGNLIVPCFTAFVLGVGPLLRAARLRWLAFALAINFKPYLIVATLPHLLRGRWRWLEGCGLMILAVYLASWGAYGAGSPSQMAANMLAYAQGGGDSYFGAFYYGGSFASLSNYLAHGVAMTPYLGSRAVETMTAAAPVATHVGQLCAGLALAAAALRPAGIPRSRLAALGVLLALTSVEFGGYAMVFALFLVFQERWRGVAGAVALTAAYLLCVPIDIPLATALRQPVNVWLTHRAVMQDVNVSAGMFARPALLIVIEIALAWATLRDVLAAARQASGLVEQRDQHVVLQLLPREKG